MSKNLRRFLPKRESKFIVTQLLLSVTRVIKRQQKRKPNITGMSLLTIQHHSSRSEYCFIARWLIKEVKLGTCTDAVKQLVDNSTGNKVVL